MRSVLLCATALLSSGCVTVVPNSTLCTTAGTLDGGMICSDTNRPVSTELNLDQTIQFLEPQAEPPRAGAVCMSAKDWAELKTAIEQACRQAGSKCKYEVPK